MQRRPRRRQDEAAVQRGNRQFREVRPLLREVSDRDLLQRSDAEVRVLHAGRVLLSRRRGQARVHPGRPRRQIQDRHLQQEQRRALPALPPPLRQRRVGGARLHPRARPGVPPLQCLRQAPPRLRLQAVCPHQVRRQRGRRLRELHRRPAPARARVQPVSPGHGPRRRGQVRPVRQESDMPRRRRGGRHQQRGERGPQAPPADALAGDFGGGHRRRRVPRRADRGPGVQRLRRGVPRGANLPGWHGRGLSGAGRAAAPPGRLLRVRRGRAGGRRAGLAPARPLFRAARRRQPLRRGARGLGARSPRQHPRRPRHVQRRAAVRVAQPGQARGRGRAPARRHVRPLQRAADHPVARRAAAARHRDHRDRLQLPAHRGRAPRRAAVGLDQARPGRGQQPPAGDRAAGVISNNHGNNNDNDNHGNNNNDNHSCLLCGRRRPAELRVEHPGRQRGGPVGGSRGVGQQADGRPLRALRRLLRLRRGRDPRSRAGQALRVPVRGGRLRRHIQAALRRRPRPRVRGHRPPHGRRHRRRDALAAVRGRRRAAGAKPRLHPLRDDARRVLARQPRRPLLAHLGEGRALPRGGHRRGCARAPGHPPQPAARGRGQLPRLPAVQRPDARRRGARAGLRRLPVPRGLLLRPRAQAVRDRARRLLRAAVGAVPDPVPPGVRGDQGGGRDRGGGVRLLRRLEPRARRDPRHDVGVQRRRAVPARLRGEPVL